MTGTLRRRLPWAAVPASMAVAVGVRRRRPQYAI